MVASIFVFVFALASTCMAVVITQGDGKNRTVEIFDYTDIDDKKEVKPLVLGLNGQSNDVDPSTSTTTKPVAVIHRHPVKKIKPPNFQITGRRINQAKCQEFIWHLKQREDETRKERTTFYKLLREKRKNENMFYTGGKARPGEYPHMAAIGWKAKTGEWTYRCGGSLISPKYILTAGHCTNAPESKAKNIADPAPKVVRLGDTNIVNATIEGFEPIILKIKRIIVHPDYNPPNRYNDIALLELEDEVTFNFLVHPACLWEFGVKSGAHATVTGWGVADLLTRAPSPDLKTAVVDFIDDKICDELWKQKWNRLWCGLDKQICAGKLSGGADACDGDSGGPLQMRMRLPASYKLAMHQVVGVTSFGSGCGTRNLPGIYSRVASFMDWIEKEVWG